MSDAYFRVKLSGMRPGELEAKRWLRQLRDDAKLSQVALAQIVGVDRRTILNAESETESGLPQGLTLLRILQELGAVVDAPVQADRPLGRLEEKADETLAGIADILALLERDEDGAGAQEGSP